MGCSFGVPGLVSSRNRPPSSPDHGQKASAHGGHSGRSRPREATPALRRPARFGQPESPGLASPWTGTPQLHLGGLGSSDPPALRQPGPGQRSPHLQHEGGPRPVPLHQGNAEGLLTPTPSAPARPRSPPRLRVRRPRSARVRARCRASSPARRGLLGTRPPTVRLGVRVHVRFPLSRPPPPQQAGDRRRLRKRTKSLEDPIRARRREFSRERAEAVATVALRLQTRAAGWKVTPGPGRPLVDDLQISNGDISPGRLSL